MGALLPLLSLVSADGWCGFSQALEHQRLGALPVRPFRQETLVTAHFVIHYDLTGQHAVTVAYAESTALHAEYNWALQCDTLGWDTPPPDSGKGGDNRYDIYVSDISWFGVTYSDGPGDDPTQEDAQSYIELASWLGWEDLGGTIAHEFGHACQMSYTDYEPVFWYENTATWMEDVALDDYDYYIGYLSQYPNPVQQPWFRFTAVTALYEYAGGVWPMFIHQWTGTPDAVRDIWELQGYHWGNYCLEDIDSVLRRDYSSGLGDALLSYGVWRYFTGSRADSFHFEEAGGWPPSTITRTHTAYPAQGDADTLKPVGPGGAGFVLFGGLSGVDSLYVWFDGEDGHPWRAALIDYGGASGSVVVELGLDSLGRGAAWAVAGGDSVVLVVVAAGWPGPGPPLSYNYGASTTGVAEESGERADPSLRWQGGRLTFTLPASGHVRLALYDVSGRLAALLYEERMEAGLHSRPLPALPAGCYFARLETGSYRSATGVIIPQ